MMTISPLAILFVPCLIWHAGLTSYTCPAGYILNTGINGCYKVYTSAQKETYTQALSICALIPGYQLVSIESSAELDFIADLIKGSVSYYWIGMERLVNCTSGCHYTYYWLSGEQFGSVPFKYDSTTNRYCFLHNNPETNPHWHTTASTTTEYGFICEGLQEFSTDEPLRSPFLTQGLQPSTQTPTTVTHDALTTKIKDSRSVMKPTASVSEPLTDLTSPGLHLSAQTTDSTSTTVTTAIRETTSVIGRSTSETQQQKESTWLQPLSLTTDPTPTTLTSETMTTTTKITIDIKSPTVTSGCPSGSTRSQPSLLTTEQQQSTQEISKAPGSSSIQPPPETSQKQSKFVATTFTMPHASEEGKVMNQALKEKMMKFHQRSCAKCKNSDQKRP